MSVSNGRQARPNLADGEVRILARVILQCFVLLSCLGCTERSVRLASTSTPRSVNDVEVRLISNLLVDQGQ